MRLLILSFFIFSINNSFAQQGLRFKVCAGDYDRNNCPVSADLSSADLELNNTHFQLYQLNGINEIPVASQLESGKNHRLWFILKGEMKKGENREYVYKKTDESIPGTKIVLQKDHNGLKMLYNKKPILNYQFNEVYPPMGVNTLYKRGGFIHPVWSPGGEELTRIQAPDHYHHYGIWNPWTKTHTNGREIDFWNLKKGEGTVRFANFMSEVEGPIFSEFSALQQHIDFNAKGPDQVAINEVLQVCAWNIDKEGKIWLIDYISNFNCPLDSGIILDAYRYGGGIGFRATEKWNKDNSSVLTSEGKDRLSADGTKGRWCIVEGASALGRCGILFMDHPSNREFPEPMRVWPINTNGGRGDMYFQFTPIRDLEWVIEKGKNYSQKYRLLLFDGKLSAEEAERYWHDFANPPLVQLIK